MDTKQFLKPIARLGRFVLFVLSSGYLYPHVCTEGMDMKAYEADVQRQVDADRAKLEKAAKAS